MPIIGLYKTFIMKKFLFFLAVTACLVTTGCSPKYLGYLYSFGSSPSEKTYYVVSPDSSVNATLEFKEYAGYLKEVCNEVGYMESNPLDAAVRIELNYGNEKFIPVKKSDRVQVDKGYSSGLGGSVNSQSGEIETNIEYQPNADTSVNVSIRAFDNGSGEPIWEIYIMSLNGMHQPTMYRLLLSAKDYIGRSSWGKQRIYIDIKTGLVRSKPMER